MSLIGIFARTFPINTPEALAAQISNSGFDVTQLNLSAIGRSTLDLTLTQEEARSIKLAFESRGVSIWGLSGTFNCIDPNEARRNQGILGCIANIQRAADMEAVSVTLCTGTRNPENMWVHHPDNSNEESWILLRKTLDQLIPLAEAGGVKLGIEPEPGNVVSDALRAERLLNELGNDSQFLTIVLDPANLITPSTLDKQEGILREAFEVLGPRIGALHAKDVVTSGFAAAGLGGMDYELVMELHSKLPNRVPVIAQDLAPEDATRVSGFLKGLYSKYESKVSS